ncbi:hypothetical protein MYAER_2068 [Microcystis aeruginosa NIES-2549]|uniref:Uncharacterized protein n=1 Tax=Microcystis aeruginosa NIES-2549 TaxID=1641812 RepID=A0A0F6U3Y9_MICAE|nr:hypothetical protein MYAER_2068 [Microcystis aeruginosa NIES-2549]
MFERCYQKLVKFSTSGHFYFENIDLPHPSNFPVKLPDLLGEDRVRGVT